MFLDIIFIEANMVTYDDFLKKYLNAVTNPLNPSFTIIYDEVDKKEEVLDTLRFLELNGYVEDIAPMVGRVSFSLTKKALELSLD